MFLSYFSSAGYCIKTSFRTCRTSVTYLAFLVHFSFKRWDYYFCKGLYFQVCAVVNIPHTLLFSVFEEYAVTEGCDCDRYSDNNATSVTGPLNKEITIDCISVWQAQHNHICVFVETMMSVLDLTWLVNTAFKIHLYPYKRPVISTFISLHCKYYISTRITLSVADSLIWCVCRALFTKCVSFLEHFCLFSCEFTVFSGVYFPIKRETCMNLTSASAVMRKCCIGFKNILKNKCT